MRILTMVLGLLAACASDPSRDDTYAEANESKPCGASWNAAGYQTVMECAAACAEVPTIQSPTPTGCMNGYVVEVNDTLGACVPNQGAVVWFFCE